MNYLIDAKEEVGDLASLTHDLFISAYNESARVTQPYDAVGAKAKNWWILPEYRFKASELAALPGASFLEGARESDVIMAGLAGMEKRLQAGMSLCVDITGFMRNQILFLMWYLRKIGVQQFDAIYSEPDHYSRKADTVFSERISVVRQVEGFAGSHQPDWHNDVLLLGVGYDHDPMARAILYKENARLVQMHSLPSLSADMYHESLLRLDRVSSISRPMDQSVYFASANDPFVTATALSQAWRELNARKPVTNLYLCPLATKAQTLGFGLFFLREMRKQPASIILPTIETYSRETSKGVGRTWLYPIQLQ